MPFEILFVSYQATPSDQLLTEGWGKNTKLVKVHLHQAKVKFFFDVCRLFFDIFYFCLV